MFESFDYICANKRDWFTDLPMLIAQQSTRHWLGKGFLFDSEENKILEFFDNMNYNDKWYEKFFKFGLQNSLLGKEYVFIKVNEDDSQSLVIPPAGFYQRVAKFDEQEQLAELMFINEQSDNVTLTWVTITKDLVVYENFKGNGKTKEILLGSVKAKVKPQDFPKTSYTIKNPWGRLPIVEITNLPMINLFGNSTTLNRFPDCAPVWNLIEYYHMSYRQRNVDRELNVTTAFANFDNETVKNMVECSENTIRNPKKDLMVNVGSAGYNSNGAGNLTVIQGNFQANNYIMDKDDLATTIYNGAGQDYKEFSGTNYTNKTQSLMNSKFSAETKMVKQAHYFPYFYKIFELLLIGANLWNGQGDRPFTFKTIDIDITNQILQDQIINSRLDNGTMTRTKAISEYDNVNKNSANKDFQEVIEEQKQFTEDNNKENNKIIDSNNDIKGATNDPS